MEKIKETRNRKNMNVWFNHESRRRKWKNKGEVMSKTLVVSFTENMQQMTPYIQEQSISRRINTK